MPRQSKGNAMQTRILRSCGKLSATAGIALATALAGPAGAQTCASPELLLGGDSPPFHSTCNGEYVAEAFCSDLFANPGPNLVFAFTLSGPSSGTFSLTSMAGGFVPVMYLSSIAEPCDSATCLAVGDTGMPIQVSGLAAGSYRLIVAAAPDAMAGSCGDFALSYDVATIDRIFFDDFDPSGSRRF